MNFLVTKQGGEQMKKSKKTIIIVTLVIAVILVIAIITAVVNSNRNKPKTQGTEQSKEEFTASLDGKYAENDNVKISINDMSYVGNHLIIKYDVVSKDENAKLFENAYNELDEFDFHLNRKIKINSDTINTKEDLSNQISYKKSDTEVIVYDVVEIDNLSDNIDLQVEFFENDYTIGNANDEDSTIDEAENEDNMTADENEDEEEDDNVEPIDEEPIDDGGEIPEDNTVEYKEEDATEEDYQEVEAEYNGEQSSEETAEQKRLDAEDDASDTELIGSIKVKTTKQDLEKDTDVVEITDGYQAQNITIEGEKLIKTSYDSFVIVETSISDVNYQKIDSQESGDPSIYRIDVRDENGNSLNQASNQSIEYDDGETTQIDENSNNIKATVKSIILLSNKDKEDMEVVPYYLTK